MSRTTVLDVRAAESSEDLAASAIDAPLAGDERADWTLDVRGWAVGRERRAVAAAALHDGLPVWRVPVDVERPRIAAATLAARDARIGFHALGSTLRLAAEFELEVRAVLDDDRTATIGRIRGRRAPLRTAFAPHRNPVMITTLGRTGSMLLMRLLSAHPEVLVYRPHRFEQRVASYWADLLLTLAEPSSFIRQIAPPGDVDDPAWWLGRDAPVPWGLKDAPVQEWLGGEAVEALAATCQARIEQLYDRIAATTNAGDATLFAEKCNLRAAALLSELYPEGRELFLVRDFRDMVTSIIAFNAKRGVQGFGRAGARDDTEYVRSLGGWAAALARAWERRRTRAHLVRYEDLVLKPEHTVGEVLRYLEVDSTGAIVSAMLDHLREELPELAQHHTSESPRASVGRWRRELDPELARLCARSLGPALSAFGYE
jgi:hypothetical protein